MTSALEDVSASLATAMTRAASAQSWLTIRYLADRDRRTAAFCIYAYFRWLDDQIDDTLADEAQRLAFLDRQMSLWRGAAVPANLAPEERLLPFLNDTCPDRAMLDLILQNMFAVMQTDASRRKRRMTQVALCNYTRHLAIAVTESIHLCIGHRQASPQGEARYAAVTGAHIAHMLRDLIEDLEAGYNNLPLEAFPQLAPTAVDLETPAGRDWICSRVQVARREFAIGRAYLAHITNWRCRLAGHAYIARFEWVLDAIERENYHLRRSYNERKSLRGRLAILTAAIDSMVAPGL